MAIEAGNHSQFITNNIYNHNNNNREYVMMNQRLGGTIFHDNREPNTNSIAATILAKEADDSSLTCNDNNNNNNNNNNNMGLTPSRKRPWEYYPIPNESSSKTCGAVGGFVSQRLKVSSSMFEQEAVLQMQRQQRELDCLIAQHMQRLRVELEERAKQQAMALASVIHGAISAKLREKDEEMQRVAKMNWALQERIRNLSVENQLWRGLAQSNEAAANSLRTDLERVLTGTTGAVEDQQKVEEDAESCCGSNEVEEEEGRGRCKGCSETAEGGVVVMPCRHVFWMCTRCKLSTRQSCLVCRSTITSTLQVHLPPLPK